MSRFGFAIARSTFIVAFVFAWCLPSFARATDSPAETARTPAAVILVDDHWLQAEIHGDTAYMNRLLMPEYRTVSASGRSADKAALLAQTVENRTSDRMAKLVAAYLRTHPLQKAVTIEGDVRKGIMSSDTFVYRDGHWRALFSQHTTAG